jgi:hypothetical protein
MAAWPVVAADGAVLACCNQDTVDRRPVPEHLWLGRVPDDDWPILHQRIRTSPVLRLVRSVGPAYLDARFGDDGSVGGTYCAGCRGLRPDVRDAARRLGSGVTGLLLEQAAARRRPDPTGLIRRHGCAPYAELVALPGARP